ncbi:MAG: bifunctional riboflavin kinase/FAD synthetase [Bacillota bacterium]|nr:bifunctional riboflavin kinase/FAD synthetase [Bacillota bacterium]
MERREFSLADPLCGRGELAVAVGTFDGVHLGHQRLIRRLVEEAGQRGLPAAVLTFEPHPLEVLRPGNGPGRLTLPEEKAALLATLGVDILLVMRFDGALAGMEPAEFCRRVLEGMLQARRVWVGFSFTFGREGRGNPAGLRRWGEERGVEVGVLPPVRVGGRTVSSTAIREAVTRGAVGRARLMLGRPYQVAGVVVPGEGRGRVLGYPTANVECHPGKVMPAPGVYAARVRCPKGSPAGLAGYLPGVANFGCRPTFGGGEPRLEVHLPGAGGDLYGSPIEVAFWRRLRGEKRFPDGAALARQLEADTRRALAMLGESTPRGAGCVDRRGTADACVYTGGTVCYNRRG